MRWYVALVFIAFLLLWLGSLALLSGMIGIEWLPSGLAVLERPSSFEGLGDAMTALDGLFSSIAIVLGLVAILFQGRELKASTDAQTQQAEALSKQIAQQQESNRLGAYTARLQFLRSEIEHMETMISSMVAQTEELKKRGDDKKLEELWEVIKSTRSKQMRYRKESTDIDEHIKRLLNVGSE